MHLHSIPHHPFLNKHHHSDYMCKTWLMRELKCSVQWETMFIFITTQSSAPNMFLDQTSPSSVMNEQMNEWMNWERLIIFQPTVFIIDKLTFYLEFLWLQPDFWLVTPGITCSKSVLSTPYQGGAWVVKKVLNSMDEGGGISPKGGTAPTKGRDGECWTSGEKRKEIDSNLKKFTSTVSFHPPQTPWSKNY